MSDFEIKVFDSNDFTAESASYLAQLLNVFLKDQPEASFFLSGGSTPGKIYEEFSTDKLKTELDWQKIKFFFGDERYVPHDDSESNFLMTKQVKKYRAAMC